jgi:spermidine synthase
MKPFLQLAQARTPDGAELSLHAHDTHFYLRVNRQPLMGTNASESEKALARLACARLGGMKQPRVLIGGLGFGFSLRQVLEIVGADARVQVAELLPEVVEWNRRYLGSVNGLLLDDRRVEVVVDDVFEVLSRAPAAILMPFCSMWTTAPWRWCRTAMPGCIRRGVLPSSRRR